MHSVHISQGKSFQPEVGSISHLYPRDSLLDTALHRAEVPIDLPLSSDITLQYSACVSACVHIDIPVRGQCHWQLFLFIQLVN